MQILLKKSARVALRAFSFVVASFLLVGLTLLIGHAVSVRNGPQLEWWHTEEINAEFVAADKSDIKTLHQYFANEEKVYQKLLQLEQEHSGDLSEQYLDRFKPGNAAYPVKQGTNFNRSYEIHPDNIKGGVLLLHGLSDSPYSLRHIGETLAAEGYYVLALRMPGHGTLPAELDRIEWQDWAAATELGARHVAGVLTSQQPFVVVGYSNGASLALKYTLDAVTANEARKPPNNTNKPDHDLRDSAELVRVPDRLIVLSPMIAVDMLAKFSPLFLWLGDINFFNQSRWIDVQPEYDPHKYNSFPVNAALQSYQISTEVARQLSKMHDREQLKRMPPILSFQSLVDKTVVASAVFDKLFQKLPVNGSEMVVFDVNNFGQLEKFIQPRNEALLERIMSQADGDFTLSVVSNKESDSLRVQAFEKSKNRPGFVTHNVPLDWPGNVYSLTHVALPFPLYDEVYGLQPEETGRGFPQLGKVQLLGESGALVLPPALLQRLRSNPFYDYVQTKIIDTLNSDAINAAEAANQ